MGDFIKMLCIKEKIKTNRKKISNNPFHHCQNYLPKKKVTFFLERKSFCNFPPLGKGWIPLPGLQSPPQTGPGHFLQVVFPKLSRACSLPRGSRAIYLLKFQFRALAQVPGTLLPGWQVSAKFAKVRYFDWSRLRLVSLCLASVLLSPLIVRKAPGTLGV